MLAAFENGVEELEDELLLFTRQELDLLELALKLRSGSGFGFGGERFASQKFRHPDTQSGGAFDEIERGVRRASFIVINQRPLNAEFVGKLLLSQSFAAPDGG